MIFNRIFKRKPKVQVFVRTCFYSDASAHKDRPEGFSHHACVQNLIETFDAAQAELTFILDTARKGEVPHFCTHYPRFPVHEICEGTEAGAFLRVLDYIEAQRYPSETILYIVEDDYLHRRGWLEVLQEGFTLPAASYVTLYDHRDKYLPEYDGLTAQIFHTPTCHWRTTPSTTNTYAMQWKTLKRDLEIHRTFSRNRKISADHEKFCRLAAEGATLLSSIPGYSTHMDPAYLSPCISWEFDRQKIKR